MILRNPDRDRYTRISNTTLEDTRLSFAARGLLCYLLSKPDKWRVKYYDLEQNGDCTEYAIRQYMKELTKHGYAVMKKRPKYDTEGNPTGKWDGTEIIIYETSHRPIEIQQVGKTTDLTNTEGSVFREVGFTEGR